MSKRITTLAPLAGAAKPKAYTAGDVRAALKLYFPHPEFGVVFEVAQATGYSAHRHIDALVMDTWPSRGLRLKAVEIKVSRSDWRREKKDPEKAEQLARFCDEFWIAAPQDVVPLSELPAAWGLLEIRPEMRAPMVVVRPAEKTKAQPLTREFLAAIMRAANRPVDRDTLDAMVGDHRARVIAEHEADVEAAAARLTENNSDGAKYWAALMADLEMTSATFHHWYSSDAGKVRRLFKAIKTSGVMQSFHGLADLQSKLGTMKANVDKAMLDLSIPKDEN